jgi:phosphate transport system protein
MQDVRHFSGELDELKARLLDMGALAEQRVVSAMRALQDRDAQQISEIVHGDRDVNVLHLEIDDRCFKLLALQQPMAVDLRTIMAAVKINGDLERVGDLAVNIAEAAARYIRHSPIKPVVDVPRMGELAQAMLHDALSAFVALDPMAARQVLIQDDLLDELNDRLFRELLRHMLNDPRTIEAGIDLILIARHLERIGDHATNIAEDVIFIVDAKDIRHRAVDAVDSTRP